MARGDTNFFYFANVDDSPGNEGCWARPGFASIKDLRGKKVAANTSAEITLSGLLATQSMTEKDVDYLNLGPNEMAPALAEGRRRCRLRLAAVARRSEEGGAGRQAARPDTDTTTYQKFGTMASPDIVIISRKLVEQHPDQARGMALGDVEGRRLYDRQSEDAAKTVAHYFKKSPEEVLEGMKAMKFFGTKDWQEHMKLHTAQMQYLAQWLYDNKKIPSVPDVAKWENTSFMPAHGATAPLLRSRVRGRRQHRPPPPPASRIQVASVASSCLPGNLPPRPGRSRRSSCHRPDRSSRRPRNSSPPANSGGRC